MQVRSKENLEKCRLDQSERESDKIQDIEQEHI